MKDNMTEHHSKELEDEKMVVCRDCHMTLEQYAQATDDRMKKDSHQIVAKVAATPRGYGAMP
jgi:protein-arginine kinase activator protein McsA